MKRKQFGQQRQMRIGNLTEVLDSIARGNRSKRQIQHDTGLSWGTVSEAVAQLMQAGFLTAGRTIPTDRFSLRPAHLHGKNSYYCFSEHCCLATGLALTEQHLNFAVHTPDGKCVARDSLRLPSQDSAATLGRFLSSSLAGLLRKYGIPEKAVATIPIALTGAVDLRKNLWRKTPHMPEVADFSLYEIAAAFPKPEIVSYEHDIISRARAVVSSLAVPPENYLFFHIGERLGMAVFQNGDFLRGAHGFAGEIGHVPESTEAGETFENRIALGALRAFAQTRKEVFPPAWTTENVEIYFQFLRPRLFRLLLTAMNLFDPAEIIIGGEALEPFSLQMAGFFEELRRHTWSGGPETFHWYAMDSCNAADGVALGALPGLRKLAATLAVDCDSC